MKTGKVFLVGAGPGDPGLITRKGLDCLRSADVVIYDQLLDESLLDEIPDKAEKIFGGKTAEHHSMEQTHINRLLVEKAIAGKNVVRLKGGDPLVFGRGSEEAEFLFQNGIPFEIVPGISSAVAVPAYAGIPVTHRGLASSFLVVTGHESPEKGLSGICWEKLATAADTLVFLMGFHNQEFIVNKLVENGRPPDTPVCVIQNGTRPEQKVVTGRLGNIVERVREESLGTPAVMIVGEVVSLREKIHWFDDRPLFGKRILVTRATEQAGRLSRLLASFGARPVEIPVISIREPDKSELDRVLPNLSKYHWLIFTSANGVTAFFHRIRRSRLDSRALHGVKIGVIGPATAAALQTQGLVADYCPSVYTSQGFLSGFKEIDISGQRFLLPRADIADKTLSEGLKQRGAIVDEIIAYRTIAEQKENPSLKFLLQKGQLDAVAFTSSSTVTGFIAAAGGQDNVSKNLKVACIGPVTAAAAAATGLKVSIIAKKSTVEGLVEAIENFYRKENL